jgi:formamidopyrimidine-DNA glycosylase
MPELPEVETIRTQIESQLVGVKITKIDSEKHGALDGASHLANFAITAARRFGKLLIIDTSGGYSLAIHLKMTGRLTLLSLGKKFPPHTHIIFHLDNDSVLTFSDYRRFGYVHVVKTKDVDTIKFVTTLGKEPLKDLTLSHFSSLLTKPKRHIKTLLLDQTKIAGIGNIYACESLWIAKIHPERAANSLKPVEVKRLFAAIEAVLSEGIKRGGASDNSYRNLMGAKGDYQNFFKVYARQGKPCARCGTKIKRLKQAGRSTFFCPVCQKM